MKFNMTARAQAVREKPTWLCLNDNCQMVFSSLDRPPVCPQCGSVKVTGTVAQVSVRHNTTTHADRVLRDVASQYKLTNLRTAREGESAHPGYAAAKEFPNAPPLSVGMGMQVPRTMTPSASFAKMPSQMTGFLPTHAQFKKPKGGIPTNVRYKTMKGDTR
jgi:hypothetical protein